MRSGALVLESAKREIHEGNGTVFIGAQYATPFHVNPSSGPCSYLVGFLDAARFAGLKTVHIPKHSETLSDLLSALIRLDWRTTDHDQSLHRDIVSACANAWRTCLQDLGLHQSPLRDGLNSLLAAIRDEPDLEWTLDTMGAYLNCAPTHVCRRFRAADLGTPGENVRRIRLERAAAYLRDTDRNHSAIAKLCGYNSAAALSRAFSQHFNCSPQHYRTENS